MIQIKKTILTLVALLAVTTGAWAEEKMVTLNSSTMSSGAVTATGLNTLLDNLYVGANPATITTSEGVITKLVIKKGSVYKDAFTEANVGVTPGTITYGSDEITVTDINAESVTLSRKGSNNWSTSSVDVYYASASGPEVAWDKAKKTGSFTMPGGNVELEPEYYPQAEFAMSTDPTPVELAPTAIDNVPATTDGAIVEAGTVANIGTSEVKQGTLMYFVSQPTGNTVPEAPDYDDDGWSENVPTANGLQEGNAYVWYYIKGAEPTNIADRTDDNTRSDSDIKPLGTNGFVTLDAEPTYAVTFADGVNPEPPAEPEWTASPATGVTKGQTVTVTYTGSKKVLGVKAEKKAAAPAADPTVTLTPGEIGDLFSWESTSKTINGITIAISGDAQFYGFGMMKVSANDPETGEPIPTTGTFTFTSSVGNIKRIDINHNVGGWRESGAGWPSSYNVYDTSTFTWSGTPAASVTLNASSNNENDCSLYNISSFVFTLEPTN